MKKDSGSCLILAFATLAAMVVGFALNGFVVSVLWGWFVVTKFELPPLTIPEAIAMVIVARTIACPPNKSNKVQDWEEWLSDFIAYSIAGPLMILAIAWIVRLFI